MVGVNAGIVGIFSATGRAVVLRVVYAYTALRVRNFHFQDQTLKGYAGI